MPYLGKQSEQVGVSIQKYEFLQATDTSSGTTSFSVPSDAGDHVNVWLNGVLLVEGGSNDYTTTNTTVVFGTAPADGDIIRIDVVESFALPDALKSSGDTMTGALKLNGGIQQQTSADLSGTYAYHQLMLSDAFTVAGDVTISDNLVLAKLSDDSNAITISNDTSTRTITGTGSLEASTLAQTPNQSLTGMTGELGSAVTGSPNLNLTSGSISSSVTFPAGHVIKTHKMENKTFTDGSHDFTMGTSYATVVYAASGGSPGATMQISGITATEGNLLKMSAYGGEVRADADATFESIVAFKIDTEYHGQFQNLQNSTNSRVPGHFGFVYTVPANFTNKTISLVARKEGTGGGGTHTMSIRSSREDVTLWMIVQEIQQ